MAVVISDLNNMVREAILPKWQNMTLAPSTFYDDIVADSKNYEMFGQTFRSKIAMKTGVASRPGLRGAGGAMPSNATPTYVRDAYLEFCRFYANARFDGLVLRLPNDEQILDTIADVLKDTKDAIPRSMDSLYAGVNSSAIAKVASSSNDGATTTVTVDSDYLWPGTRRLWTGCYIDVNSDIGGYGSGTERCTNKAVTVTSGTTFTIAEASTTIADGDYVFFEDSSGTQVDVKPMGIAAIIDGPDATDSNHWVDDDESITATKSIQGVSGASNAYWRAQVLSAASNRYLDEELIADAFLQVFIATGKQPVASEYKLLSCPEVLLGYRKRVGRERQWVNKQTVRHGVPTVEVDVNGMLVDWATPLSAGRAVLYGVHKPSLVRKDTGGIHAITPGFKQVQGYDQMEMDFAAYGQLGVVDRRPHWKIDGLTE